MKKTFFFIKDLSDFRIQNKYLYLCHSRSGKSFINFQPESFLYPGLFSQCLQMGKQKTQSNFHSTKKPTSIKTTQVWLKISPSLKRKNFWRKEILCWWEGVNQSVGRQYLSWQGIKRKHPLTTNNQPSQSHSNHKEKTADFSK